MLFFVCVCEKCRERAAWQKTLSIDLLFAYLGRIPSEIFLRL